MLNVVAIMGRLVADPELRTTGNGTNVCSFRIACDRNFAQKGQERQADFIDVVAWRQSAEFICKYFQKGSLIAVEGSLQSRQYQDKNGNKRTAVEVLANQINFAGGKKPGGQPVDDGGEAPPKDYREPAPAYSQGSADDFAVISDDDDLPF
ncbi:MAG: single-stranded DNA-binding protein [Faecalibacterium sp.]|jgi:single-strand DNA-binding protein